MTRTWLLIAIFCCLSMGCRTSAPVLVAEELGESGWYEIEGRYKAKSLFRRSKSESERLDVAGAPCDELIREREEKHQVFVLVPGILGAGKEWEPVIEKLARPGRSLFFFRWVPLDHLDTLSRGLGAGLRALASCLDGEGDELIVLAHSAGGIIAAQAASRVSTRAGAPSVRVFTAASALAGIQVRKEAGEDDESEEEEGEGEEVEAGAPSPEAEAKAENRYFVTAMGGAFRDYAPVGKGVEVFHLRTQAPADPVMKPRRDGKLPNDPRVGVPGAYQVSLPSKLGHDQSLLYATERIEDGAWVKWRTSPRVPAPASAQGAR
jgi:pimeloyl-ACP methyl ester carboxylesterase